MNGEPQPVEAPGAYKADKWNIMKAAGVWWAECPDEWLGPCMCESFDTHAEAVAHVIKNAEEPDA